MKLPIVPPRRGLNDAFAYAEQPEESTAISKNVRTVEADTGRLRISQRAGYKKYNSNAFGGNYIAWSESLDQNDKNGVGATEGWKTNDFTRFRKDTTLAPDDRTEAFLVTQSTDGVVGYIEQEISVKDLDEGAAQNQRTGGGSSGLLEDTEDLVFSVFLKWSGRSVTQDTKILIRQDSSTSEGTYCTEFTGSWDTSTGALTLSSGSGTRVDELRNGWYRVFVSLAWDAAYESTSDRLSVYIEPYSTGTANTEELGCFVWGAQLERGTLPGDYIPQDGPFDLEGTQKTQELVAFNHSNPSKDYVEETGVDQTQIRLPKKRDAVRGAADDYGNLYVIDGPSSVSKLNADKKEVFSIDVSLADEKHSLGAIHVDKSGSIFVGVSEGGDENLSQIFHYRQGPDVGADGELVEEAAHLVWSYTVGGYVVDIDVYEHELFVGLNKSQTGEARIVVLRTIDGVSPTFAREYRVAHPLFGMEVDSKGSVFATSPSQNPRGINPQDIYIRAQTVSWTPTDYINYQSEVWCWLDAGELDGPGILSASTYQEEDKVLLWKDLTGQGRDLRVPVDTVSGGTTVTSPRFRRYGIGSRPTVTFDGTSQGLVSGENPSTAPSSKQDHKTTIPSYEDAASTLFIVARPGYSNEGENVGAVADGVQGAILGQQVHDKATGNDRFKVVCSNRQSSDAVKPTYGVGETPDGMISVFHDYNAGGSQPADFDLQAQAGTVPNVVVICVVATGGAASTIRCNGVDVEADYTNASTVEGTGYTSVGWFNEDADFGFYTGDIAEIISYQSVLDDAVIELHEGYLMNKYGCQVRLGDGTPGNHPYAAAFATDPPTKCPIAPGKADPNPINSSGPVVAKFDSSGDLAWVISNYYGTGWDIVAGKDDDLFTIGETTGDDVTEPAEEKGQGYIRKLLDKGDSVDADNLVAKQQHNLISDPTDYSTGNWSSAGVAIGVGGSTVAPDGSDAQHVDDNSAVTLGYVYQDVDTAKLVDKEPYIFSVYLKQDPAAPSPTRSRIILWQPSGSNLADVDYTWADGLVDPGQVVHGLEDPKITAEVCEDAGNGWIRFAVGFVWDKSDADSLRVEIQPSNAGGASGEGAVWIWGAQLERGTRPTAFSEGENADFRTPITQVGPYRIGREVPKLSVDSFGNLFVPAIQRQGSDSLIGSPKTHFGCRIYDRKLQLKRVLNFGVDDLNRQGCYQAIPNQFSPDYTPRSTGVIRNRCLFTEQLNASTGFWSAGTITAVIEAIGAPDGTITATELTGADNGDSLSKQFTDLLDGEDYTFSCFVKRGTSDDPYIRIGDTTGTATTTVKVDYSVNPPTFTRQDVGGGTHKHTVEKVSNDFYRVSVAFTYQASEGNGLIAIYPSFTSSSTVFAWGLQLEHGDQVTDYQAVRGSTPYPPKPSEDSVDLADKATFLCQRSHLRFTLYDSPPWTLGTDVVVAAVGGTEDPLGKSETVSVDDSASGSGSGVSLNVSPSDKDADGNAILVDGETYKFDCYVSNPGSPTGVKARLEHNTGTAFTEKVVNYGTPNTFSESSAGDGTHFTTHEIVYSGDDSEVEWQRLEVHLTYNKDDGDGSLNCKIDPKASGEIFYLWGARFSKADGLPTVKTRKLVKEKPNGLPERSSKLVSIYSGNVYTAGRDGNLRIAYGGSGALDQKARYVSATAFLQKLYATDGSRHIVYEPTIDGAVKPFVAEKGEIPERTQLITNWRNRLVLGRSSEDPHVWYMSAIGNPNDWDYFTPPLTSDKAAFYASTRAGRSPDIINSLCSYDERTFIVGCDAALWYMQDDPLAGGTWQQITDITGMHFGNHAWCKDPMGYLYFFGSRGGFYRMIPGQKPQRMTENTIERRLSDVDLDNYYFDCFWNYRAEGIEIFQIPFGAGGTAVKHYFYGMRYDEWREDEFGSTVHQPTAATIIDGDKPRDRKLLIASEDGYILEWDEETKNDDGTAIDSKELIGPYQANDGAEARWSQLEMVLSQSTDGATYKLYRGEDAETLGSAIETGTLAAGYNPRKFGRMRGANLWLEISNSTAGETWAFEKGHVVVNPAGRTRDRSY